MQILFPHDEFRLTQEKFIYDVMESLENNKNILLHAPTGLGKTAAVLASTLSFALEKEKTIFFLTSRHTQHKIALETLELIKKKHDLNFEVVDFIGKKWMCLQPGVQELHGSEFYNFCNDLVEKRNCMFYESLKTKGKLSLNAKLTMDEIRENEPGADNVIEISNKHRVCPYEINALMAQKAKVIIADYFHILSPTIRDHLFKKINKSLDDCIIIFDEAHNLPDRIRDLMTINLSTFIIKRAANEAKSLGYKEVGEDIDKFHDTLNDLAKRIDLDESEALISKEEFIHEVIKIDDYDNLIHSSMMIAEKILENKKKSFNTTLAAFLQAWLEQDEGFTRILKRKFDGATSYVLSYRCLDPSFIMKEIANEALILGMSGTLTPLEMYRDLLGIDAQIKEYPNSFPDKNRMNLIVPKTTTKYDQREREMYNKIASLTAAITNSIPGNSMVFFPSYELLEKVNEFFSELNDKETLKEMKGLNKLERQEILDLFKKNKDKGSVLLAASSGSFGEGIDLPGDFLKGVIVVGLPLARPDLETKELIKYYEARFKKGWDYGYVYPALIKSQQNAGRCIRSQHDKGVIIFLDERYAWKNYFKCFPKDYKIKLSHNPVKLVRDFFDNP